MVSLLSHLQEITEEELLILEHRQQVMQHLYTSQSQFIIERERFLSVDRMVVIRKHTRFVHFPKHKHDYIEMNYVFHGTLTQNVGEEQITRCGKYRGNLHKRGAAI